MLVLRKATVEDVPTLKRWGRNQHVITATGSDGPVDWGWEEEISKHVPWRETLIAEFNSRPVGMLQIMDPREEESHYWGDIESNLRAIDIWIGDESDLGKGYGTQMMQLAFSRCFANSDVQGIVIDPLADNTKALRFYERLGFRKVESRLFGEDECWICRFDRIAL